MEHPDGIDPARITIINEGKRKTGPVVYWMQRDQRVNDNWALLYALQLAREANVPLYVIFCFTASFNNAPLRHYAFMLKGLQKVEQELLKYNIPFVLLTGEAEEEIPEFVKKISAGVLITDFNPLKIVSHWKSGVKEKIDIPFYEVDAHNIVPCRAASPKLEFAAYTLRPKIKKVLDNYLTEYPALVKMKQPVENIRNNWGQVLNSNAIDKTVNEVTWLLPGEEEALKTLQNFIDDKFQGYAEKRNNPALDFTSNLSPYFHFGQIAPQRTALIVLGLNDYPGTQSAFMEELIVRRELADNFCFYNPDYDSFRGFHPWAQETLNAHRADEREYIYSNEELENSLTHDELWNAAQKEMVIKGKMHGYMRMYWAKKILEWSRTPEEALAAAIYLNDRYEIDGRDPNGYCGIAWSIGGVHDRPWGERKIFGKIRYMNLNGCRRKFDVDLYIEKIKSLAL